MVGRYLINERCYWFCSSWFVFYIYLNLDISEKPSEHTETIIPHLSDLFDQAPDRMGLDHVFLLINLLYYRSSILTAMLIIFVNNLGRSIATIASLILVFNFFVTFWYKRGIIPLYRVYQYFEFWSIYHFWLGFFQNQNLFFNCFVFVFVSDFFFINAKIVEFVNNYCVFFVLFFAIVFQKVFQSGLHPIKDCFIQIKNNEYFFDGNIVEYVRKLIAIIVNYNYNFFWTFENLLGLVIFKPPCISESISMRFCCFRKIDIWFFNY